MTRATQTLWPLVWAAACAAITGGAGQPFEVIFAGAYTHTVRGSIPPARAFQGPAPNSRPATPGN